jgi:hypothetical protein
MTNNVGSTHYAGDPALQKYLPTYANLPLAPKGSQGAIDFPYTISQPTITGNYFWWTGGGVINVGFPYYSNDCWEYLRAAMVDSNFDAVILWLGWAAASFKWTTADLMNFDFGYWRFVNADYAPAGAVNSRTFYNPSQWAAIYNQSKVAAPTVTTQPISGGGSGATKSGAGRVNLSGFGDTTPINAYGPPYSRMLIQQLWWSQADIDAFYGSLEKYADPKNISASCLEAMHSNWSQVLANYARVPGGPIIPSITLAPCPMQDSFLQGFAIFVASVVTSYVGGELASLFIPATVGAEVSAEGTLDAATQAQLDAATQDAITQAVTNAATMVTQTTAQTAASVAAPVATTVADTSGEVLASFTVTSTALPAAGVTAADVASAAVAAAAAVSVPLTTAPSVADVNSTVSQPDISGDQPPPVIPPASGFTLPPGVNPGQLVSAGGTLIKAITGGGSQPVQNPSGTVPGGPGTSPAGTLFGMPLLALAIAAAVVILASNGSKSK